MMKNSQPQRMVIGLIISLSLLGIHEIVLKQHVLRDEHAEMKQASKLASKWMLLIDEHKKDLGIESDLTTTIPYERMLGSEYTPVTTTLGSLQAKELSTNPDFSALVVRFLREAGIDSTQKVGVTLSGSFPALGVSVLAALQVLKIDVILLSSLGASSWGANQAGAMWIDYENWLVQMGGLEYKSRVVTYGGENDNGSSIFPEGMTLMDSTLSKYEDRVFLPESLQESIAAKTQLLMGESADLLINIGGNQASLGGCSHAFDIPPGLNWDLPSCVHDNRGLILVLSEHGIPVIQLLNIRELAIHYGIQTPYRNSHQESKLVYHDYKTDPGHTIVALIIFTGCILWIHKGREEC